MHTNVNVSYQVAFPQKIPKHLITPEIAAANALQQRFSHLHSLFKLLYHRMPDISDLGCGIVLGAYDDLAAATGMIEVSHDEFTRRAQNQQPSLKLVKGARK